MVFVWRYLQRRPYRYGTIFKIGTSGGTTFGIAQPGFFNGWRPDAGWFDNWQRRGVLWHDQQQHALL
jgi:hypothetical protein